MTATLATSQSLLERLQDRADAGAWQRLLAVYEPWLRGWLTRHDLQAADAEDVLQDVLVTVSQELPGFVHNGRPGAFRNWLRTILTNRVRTFLRGCRRQFALSPSWLDELEADDSTLSRQWDQEHDQQLARRMLAVIRSEFNATTWQVFQGLMLEDRPAADVARELGITANVVYVAKSRVLTRLRAELRGLMET
jgi:RNA polymerase sigma-70 factor (ECF subfamily)